MGEGEAVLIREVPAEVCRNCATWNDKRGYCNREATPDAGFCSRGRQDLMEEVEWLKREGKLPARRNTTSKKQFLK